ncbi:MAG TPA: sigma-70 family RNA polymerase sigma factor [Thermoleophilaceae bacterium]
MSAAGAVVATGTAASDTELVAGVRAGDDGAFEELYRRYQRRIVSFVRRVTRDDARAEDVTQEAFVSALRRMRATDSEILFKPWIYEIARNAAIDSWRRTSRAEEISINQDELMRPSDRARLVGSGAPDTSLLDKERIDHLRCAMDELSQTHHRILVMRELEGLSYREIGERLELTRPAVESTLFRARRRLEREYEEIEAGRRCQAMEGVIARISQGGESETDLRRLSKHARRCSACRRHAREMGVEPLRSRRVAAKAAALLPLPGFLRRRFSASQAAPPPSADPNIITTLMGPTAHAGAAVAERAAALVAAVAIAGAGGAVLGTTGTPHRSAPAAAHHHGAAAGAGPAPARESRPRFGEGTAGAGPGLRRREWGKRSESGGAKPEGRSHTPAGAKQSAAPKLSPPAHIDSPSAPSVPATPPIRVTPPATPAVPTTPAKPGLPSTQVDQPRSPLALPSAPAATDAAAGVPSPVQLGV